MVKFKTAFLAIVFTLLPGCMGPEAEFGGTFSQGVSSLFSMESAKVWLQKVNFNVHKGVNDNSPLRLDLLIVKNDALLQSLKGLTADQYFTERTQIQRDHPGQIQLYTWEILPGHRLQPMKINIEKVSSAGVIIFARYRSPGAHRHLISNEREITINLEQHDFNVQKVKWFPKFVNSAI